MFWPAVPARPTMFSIGLSIICIILSTMFWIVGYNDLIQINYMIRFPSSWTWVFTHHNLIHLIFNIIGILLYIPLVERHIPKRWIILSILILAPYQVIVAEAIELATNMWPEIVMLQFFGFSGIICFWIAFLITTNMEKFRFLPFWFGSDWIWLIVSTAACLLTIPSHMGQIFHSFGFIAGICVGAMYNPHGIIQRK